MARQPAKLRKLHITRVDRVAEGANPDAVISLYKAVATRPGLGSMAGMDRLPEPEANRRPMADFPSPAAGTPHDFMDPNGDGNCDICGLAAGEDIHQEAIAKQRSLSDLALALDALSDELLDSLGVADPDDPDSVTKFRTRLAKRDFSDTQRQTMAGKGQALPDGSFPIANTSDLKNAIQAIGRAKNPAAAKAHIISRARSLGATNLLPDGWVSKGATPMPIDRDALDQEMKDLLTSLETERDTATADLAKANTELADIKKAAPVKAPATATEPVPEAIQKRLDEAERVAKEYADRVTTMEKANRTREFIAKAADFKEIGGAAELGPVLMEAADNMTEEGYKALESYLKTANARAHEAHTILSKERGTAMVGDPDIMSEVEQLTKAKQATDPGLSDAQARTRVLSEHPALYSRYLDARAAK